MEMTGYVVYSLWFTVYSLQFSHSLTPLSFQRMLESAFDFSNS
jgi:hypothetical protein